MGQTILQTPFEVNQFWDSLALKDKFNYRIPSPINEELLGEIKNSFKITQFRNSKFQRVKQNDLFVYNESLWIVSERSKNFIALKSPSDEEQLINILDFPVPLVCLNNLNKLNEGLKFHHEEYGELEILNITSTLILAQKVSSREIKVIENSSIIDTQFLILSSFDNGKLDAIYNEYQIILLEIYNELTAFNSNKENYNTTIKHLHTDFENGEAEAVEQTINLLLCRPLDWIIGSCYSSSDINFNLSNKMLTADYIFNFGGLKLDIAKKDDRQTYENILYSITLKTIHNIFSIDLGNIIGSVVFNGYVKHMDKSTGHYINSCILSLLVDREKFLSIDLINVDPKLCFKALKGIGSAHLAEITPIIPILRTNKEDKRFIEPTMLTDNLNAYSNIALMDWEDFEMLVREIFEKEFSLNGGEVKVTRASRDGGIDAVAFDPDPIRGGKIVIQAKRYTNTVEVSAVRDLYGTMIHEGASKGILVTTSDYGKDSYEFVKDKPITLLNGGHILYLLEKHGHKARINLVEAKNNK